MENCLSCVESDRGRARRGLDAWRQGGEGELVQPAFRVPGQRCVRRPWRSWGPAPVPCTPGLAFEESSSASRPLPKLMAQTKACGEGAGRGGCRTSGPGTGDTGEGPRTWVSQPEQRSLSAECQEEPGQVPLPWCGHCCIRDHLAWVGGVAMQPPPEQLHLLLKPTWGGDTPYLKAWPAALKVCQGLFKPPSSLHEGPWRAQGWGPRAALLPLSSPGARCPAKAWKTGPCVWRALGFGQEGGPARHWKKAIQTPSEGLPNFAGVAHSPAAAC